MAHWQFRPLNPNEPSGSSISDDNFADEERTSVEILIRETLQNPLDARSNKSVVRVAYKLVTIDAEQSSFTKALFSDNWIMHFRAGELIKPEEGKPSKMTFLVIEDFGTTGLEGCYTDSSQDGRTENWNAFWFREGEGAKAIKSNGGAGQGKITLFLASRLRSVFALTKRQSDSSELLFGCCRFKRNYKLEVGGERWAKEARWGAQQDPKFLATPLVDPSLLNTVKQELKLSRSNEAGTSFLVPQPIGEITEESLRNAVVNEFFFAIRRGQLIVEVGDITLNAKTIVDVAEAMGDSCRLTKGFRHFLADAAKIESGAPPTATAKESWTRDAKLNESAFDPKELTALKTAFEKSELVSVDFPVLVKKKSSTEKISAKFRVLLQQDQNADRSQELFIRQDLGIDGEKRLRSARTILPVMALTFIDDTDLSGLLVAAEEPTHRNWNAKRPKVVGMYSAPEAVLNAVRNAALRLVQLISPTASKDETALAVYFSDPTAEKTKKRGADGPNPGVPDTPSPVPSIPPPKPKPVTIQVLNDGFEVRASKAEGYKYPVQCHVELAYATAWGDAFKHWDAADFWVSDEKSYPLAQSGTSDISKELNFIDFQLDSEDSWLRVSGFDQKRRLVIRTKFEGAPDGTDN